MIQMLRIAVCVIIAGAQCSTAFSQTGTLDGFELVRNEDGIAVHERWVTFPGSDPPVTAREVKSEFYIHGKLTDAVALIRDKTQVSNWQNHVTEFEFYPSTDSVWREYSYRDIPWPVSDQDHYLEYTICNRGGASGTFISFATVEDDKLIPVREGVSRMTLAGSWYLQEVSAGKIKVTYRILSMPGNLPRFLTDPVIRNNLMSTVRSYIDILEAGYSAR